MHYGKWHKGIVIAPEEFLRDISHRVTCPYINELTTQETVR